MNADVDVGLLQLSERRSLTDRDHVYIDNTHDLNLYSIFVGRITGIACLFVRPFVLHKLLTRKQDDKEKNKIGANVT